MSRGVDKWFLGIVVVLAGAGFLVFISASLGLLARDGARLSAVVFNQFFFGLSLGTIALFVFSKINYRAWRKYSLLIFAASLFLTLLVFVPGIGLSLKGAVRWLHVGPFTLQPAEFLKLGLVVYLAAWLAAMRDKMHMLRYGLVPLIIVLGFVGANLLSQPDTGTFAVALVAGIALFIANGARWKDVGIFFSLAAAGVFAVVYTRPYAYERIATFLNPSGDVQGAGWQLKQALIALGSGEVVGRGFGHGIQKFSYLPEPINDSIFAVAGEEFGFVGAAAIVALFAAFALRGLSIARRAPDAFSRLLVTGIVILITGQAFLNMGSMLGILPLTGVPLPFVSHGGTAMLFTFIGAGIVLNISRYART